MARVDFAAPALFRFSTVEDKTGYHHPSPNLALQVRVLGRVDENRQPAVRRAELLDLCEKRVVEEVAFRDSLNHGAIEARAEVECNIRNVSTCGEPAEHGFRIEVLTAKGR